jgi:hypothetical protein
MFDLMSIRENFHFNQKFDCIEGFEDCGSQGRTCNIVNHDPWPAQKVEAASGLLLYPWKHKGRDDLQYVKQVLDACQNAGLKVVATVCDMATTMSRP